MAKCKKAHHCNRQDCGDEACQIVKKSVETLEESLKEIRETRNNAQLISEQLKLKTKR